MNWYLLIGTLLLSLSAHSNSAQHLTDEKHPNATENKCMGVLSQSTFSDLHGIELTQLSSARLGKVLVSIKCPKNALETYYTERNWSLTQERSKHSIASGSASGSANYVQNYCLEWFFPLGSLLNCRAFAVVYTLDDVILHIASARDF